MRLKHSSIVNAHHYPQVLSLMMFGPMTPLLVAAVAFVSPMASLTLMALLISSMFFGG